MITPSILAGIFLGFSMGGNDAANVFGTAVANRIIPHKRAIIVLCAAVILGAITQGHHGFETIGKIAHLPPAAATIACLSSAIVVAVMTWLSLPASTSQSIIGAIMGIAVYDNSLDFKPLIKVFSSWLLTPICAAVFSYILYYLFSYIFRKINNPFYTDRLLLIGFYLAGGYGAYALGANGVANVTGVYVAGNLLTPIQGAIIGALSICAGAATFGKNVMYTIGRDLIPLSHFSAFIAIFSQAITVHLFAHIGVPVSTAQAIIGAVLGIGAATQTRTVNTNTLSNIVFGWVSTPTASAILSFGLFLGYNKL